MKVHECSHPADALRCRGNQAARWWVCTRCGSRWDRPEESGTTSAASTKAVNVDEKAPKLVSIHGPRQVDLTQRGAPRTLREEPSSGSVQRSKTPTRASHPEHFELNTDHEDWDDAEMINPNAELARTLRSRGWLLASILVMISLVEAGRTAQLPGTMFGSPRDQLWWHREDNCWKEHPPIEFPRVGCAVFPRNQVRKDWLADTSGTWVEMNQQERRRVASLWLSSSLADEEINSTPRLIRRARDRGIDDQLAMDLAVGWEYERAEDKVEALRLLREHRPARVALTLLPDNKVQRENNEFAVRLAHLQLSAGRGPVDVAGRPSGLPSFLSSAKPLHSEECPFDIAKVKFTGQRSTRMDPVGGQIKVIDDDWPSQRSRAVAVPWTGSTIFPVLPPIMLPEALSSLARNLAKSAAHDFFLFQSEQHALQAELAVLPSEQHALQPELAVLLSEQHALLREPSAHSLPAAFPSHRILEGTRTSAASARPSGDVLSNEFDWDDFLADVETEETRFLSGGTPFARDEAADAKEATAFPSEEEARVARELREIVLDPTASEEAKRSVVAPDIRREVYRLHRNLGHPEKRTFLRALKHAGVKAEILKYVKDEFSCPICLRRQRPSSHRPGHLSREMGFNEVIGIDLMFFRKLTLLNCLCWGTNFQWVEPLPDKKAETVTAALLSSWFAHYGTPRMVVADQGGEFAGKYFVDALSDAGVIIHLIDEKLATVIDEAAVRDGQEMRLAISETVWTRNQYYDRSGYSPHQRVFGSSPRVPATLLSDDMIDSNLIVGGASDSWHRSQEIRAAARKAWMQQQHRAAVQRAVHANTRTADDKPLKAGETVYVWRETADYVGWTGPGVIVAESDNRRSLWVSLRGYLIKASREQVRSASPEEHLGVELIKAISKEMLEGLESGTIRNYRDIEQEGAPPGREHTSISDGSRKRPLETIEEELAEYEPSPVEEAANAASPEAPMTSEGDDRDQDMSLGETSTHIPSEAPLESTPPSRRLSAVGPEAPPSPGYGPAATPSATTPRTRPMPYPFNSSAAAWPRPQASANYFEVFVKGKDGTMDGEPKRRRDASAMFCNRDRAFYITKKKESPGQVEMRELNVEEKKIFRKSRAKEVQSLLDSGAITILSIKDSLQFAREHPEHVLTSRYVDRWKPEDGVTFPKDFDVKRITPDFRAKLGPKSRWCVVGWQDPMIHAVERSAPTPLTVSMYLFMQLCACRSWPAWVKDVKTAFLQGRPTTRKQKLACRMPSDEAFESYDARQLIVLETEVYGLVSGPAWWRRSLLELLVRDLGYRISPYDRCVLTLDGNSEDEDSELDSSTGQLRCLRDRGRLRRTQGIIVVEVDDLLEAGGPRHRQLMERLETKLKFGKIQCLRDQPNGTSYAGRRIHQDRDWGFRYTMDDYIEQRLKPVRHERKTLKKDADQTPVSVGEEAQLRGTVAAVNWVAREGRPDASAAASIYSGIFGKAVVGDIDRVNDVVFKLKEHPLSFRVHPLKESEIRHFVIADSSFDAKGAEKPQHGCLQGATTSALNAGQIAKVSLLGWRSRRMRRKAGNTLLCESISLSTALGALERQSAMWLSFTVSHFDPRQMAQDEDEERGLHGEGTVVLEENEFYVDPLSVAVVDAKSLFDASIADQSTGEDDRAALEVAIIKDSLAKLRGRLRWVPHNTNPADHLTKAVGAHEQPLMDLMLSGKYRIEQEHEVLERGKQSNLRLKSKI
ncbi:GIP [Symbiodinium sp. CCMP2592]|nr:GIP [Symbiodinium sp. CCMP2592]